MSGPSSFVCGSQASRTLLPPFEPTCYAHLTIPSTPPPEFFEGKQFGNIMESCRNLQALMASVPQNPLLLTPPSNQAQRPIKVPKRPCNQNRTQKYIIPEDHDFRTPGSPSPRNTPRPEKRTRGDDSDDSDGASEPIRISSRKRTCRFFEGDNVPSGPSGITTRSNGSIHHRSTETSKPIYSLPALQGFSRRLSFAELPSDPFATATGFKGGLRQSTKRNEHVAPSTPRRLSIAPKILPLGLERSNYHNLEDRQSDSLHNGQIQDNEESRASESRDSRLDSSPIENRNSTENLDEDDEEELEGWTAQEDRLLVELVLQKVQLSKAEWRDCARHLGCKSNMANRRWERLLAGGEIGLKNYATRR